MPLGGYRGAGHKYIYGGNDNVKYARWKKKDT